MKLEEAKTLQRVLSEQGTELVLDHNDHTCTRGCAVTVEILVAAEDLAKVQQVMKSEWAQHASGQQVRWELLDEVFDSGRSQAVCPACGTSFATSSRQCPDCGLCF